MNSIQPAAHVRAVTGFGDSEAGTGSIVSCAGNRSLLWLLVRFLPVVALICLSITPAHADGVSGKISNGQPVTGTLSASGTDTYTFKVTGGSSFVVTVSETGTHVKGFAPEIDLAAPVSGDGPGFGRPLHAYLEQTNAAEGTWSVKVHRADEGGTTAGSYALTLIQLPGTIPPSGGIAGGAMSPGAANPGSFSSGDAVDVWTFSGTAGHTKTLTLNQTGGAGFFSEIHVFAPNGDFAGGFGCSKGCSNDFPIATEGVYTALVLRNDNTDVTGKYTLSVNDKN